MAKEVIRPDVGKKADFFYEVGDINVTQTVVDRMMAKIYQRDQGKSARTEQTLGIYDAYGRVRNPSESEFASRLRQDAIQLIEVKTPRLSTEEKEYMGLLLPDLVGALVLDKNHIDKVYDKDITSISRIALDWFLNPEEIDQTHIRVGYGGEEIVNSRAPAYIVPALTTLDRVKDVYGRYTNWALHHELHKRTGNSEAVNSWVGQKIQETIESKERKKDQHFTQDDYLEEIQLAKHLPINGTRQILQDAWVEFTGQKPEMDELAKKYHFTDKLPKIVVFNASHAGIEIDRMDENKTLAARHQTQRLLKGYAETVHPDVAQNVVFENDSPWSEHDYYTQMLILYMSDLIDGENGEKKTVEAKLLQFGKHHQRDQAEPLMGMQRSDLYGKLHVFFFEDPIATPDWAEKIPSPKVMEKPYESPRNVIFHQGRPEIKFGLYRKVASEKATLSSFIKWLDQRRSLSFGDPNIAEDVLKKAQDLHKASNGKRDFLGCLGQVVNKTARGPAKSVFFEFIGSQVFQEADDKEKAWQEFSKRLQRDVELVNPEQTQLLIQKLTARQESMRSLNQSVNLAKQKDDHHALDFLYNTPEGQEVSSERNRLEFVIPQGDIPVYYPLADADSIVWPNNERPSLARYSAKLDAAKKTHKNLTGTIGYAETKIIPVVLDQQNGWMIFDNGLNEYVNTSLQSKKVQVSDWMANDAEELKSTYLRLEAMEKEGRALNEIVAELEKRTRSIMELRTDSVMRSSDTQRDAVIAFVTQQLMPDVIRTARQMTLQEAAAEVTKATAVQRDYKSILADIDPDENDAERKYNSMLYKTFSSPNGSTKPEDLGEGVLFAAHKSVETV